MNLHYMCRRILVSLSKQSRCQMLFAILLLTLPFCANAFQLSPSAIQEPEGTGIQLTVTIEAGDWRAPNQELVEPQESAQFEIHDRDLAGDLTFHDSVLMMIEDLPPPAVAISFFQASPASIEQSQTTTLSWTVSNADNCTASGADTPEIHVLDSAGARGETVQVELMFDTKVSEYRTLEFKVLFDRAVFSSVNTDLCPKAEFSNFIVFHCRQMDFPDDNKIRFALLSLFSHVPTGNLGSLRFEIHDDAPTGPSILSIEDVIIEGDVPTGNFDGTVTVVESEIVFANGFEEL